MLTWPLAVLFLTGIFGSWLAKGISGGHFHWWLPIIPSIGTGLLWGYVSKRTENLTFATMLFDAIYTGAFVIGFLLLGDKLNWHQALGIILAMIGIALMA